MLKRFIKCSVLSMMVLASVATPQVATNAKAKKNPGRFKYTRTIHTRKQLIQQAKRDSNYDYKKDKLDDVYLDQDCKWYSQHRQLLKFTVYRKAYLKNLLNLNSKTPRKDRISNNHTQAKIFNFLVNYINLPNNSYKLGVYTGITSNTIKGKYMKNLQFARGYIKGSLEANYPGVMSAYLGYQEDNGKLSYQQLGLTHYHNAEALGKRIGKKVCLNALTAKYIDKAFKKSGLSKKYYPDYFNGVNEYPYSDSKYARGIVNKYPLHHRIYFPKQVTMDTKWLAGIELGKYNNKAARATAANFKKYFDDDYVGKHTEKYQKQFRNNYKINKIYVKRYANDYPNNATNKYYIYNRSNQKKSGIYFDMDNSQHIGQMPNTKGL